MQRTWNVSTLATERIIPLLTSDLRNAQFVQCDVTSFEAQVKLFKRAKETSPELSVDIVVACAGIAPNDTVFNVEGKA